MTTILVTGAKGFIGRNLVARLKTEPEIELLECDLDSENGYLETAAAKADFVYHLAGINRPKNETEFEEGNRGLTEQLVDALSKSGRKASIFLTSSIQAALDNPYGKSKRGAELAVSAYSSSTGATCFTYRLPNVFGKWCRPNYNSVIATWCHNSTRGVPLQINDPATTLSLVYIDDVVESFMNAWQGLVVPAADGYCRVDTTYDRSLGEIAAMLDSFVRSRSGLMMPSLEDPFAKKLYATWLSYLPSDSFAYSLDMKRDERGWLAEFIKSTSFGQVFVSRTKPGVTRGRHWHHSKVEKFLVVSGNAVIRFRKIDEGQVHEYFVSGENLKVVDIPVGYTHSITNVGEVDLITIFWADELFDQSRPDTFFLEV